jgi:hypothetical protein
LCEMLAKLVGNIYLNNKYIDNIIILIYYKVILKTI